MVYRTHKLKITQDYFEGVISGQKTFEHRYNDRDFQRRDQLHLMEYDAIKKRHTGREAVVDISYISNYPPALKDGYICMAIILRKTIKCEAR